MTLGVLGGAVVMVRVCVQVDIGRSCPPLEFGETTLVSGACREELGGLVGDDVGVVVGNVFASCGCSLASQTTLGDGN